MLDAAVVVAAGPESPGSSLRLQLFPCSFHAMIKNTANIMGEVQGDTDTRPLSPYIQYKAGAQSGCLFSRSKGDGEFEGRDKVTRRRRGSRCGANGEKELFAAVGRAGVPPAILESSGHPSSLKLFKVLLVWGQARGLPLHLMITFLSSP